MTDKLSWETINRYVDGELSPRDAAEVAKAVATDPEFADQVSVLSSLKAAVAQSTDGLRRDLDLSEARKKKTWIPWAAGFAAVLLACTLMSILVLKSGLLQPASGIRLAQAIHSEWLNAQPMQRDPKHKDLLQTTMVGLDLDAYVPDLSKVDLSFSGIRKVTTQGVEGLHIGYLGPSGCMVSLVVFRNHIRLSKELSYFKLSTDGRPIYGWRVGTTGFYLLAHKMDPGRLHTIAEVVHRLTRARLPLDPTSVIALNDARTTGQPCLS